MVTGGCPQQAPTDSTPDVLDQLENVVEDLDDSSTNTNDNDAAGEDVRGGGRQGGGNEDANRITAPDISSATMKNKAIVVRLSANSNDDNALVFNIVSPPASGTLSAVTQLSAKMASVTYTPPEGFTGLAQFSYTASHNTTTSNVGTVRMNVYPVVQFRVEPLDGRRPLAIRAFAVVGEGELLPEGEYRWQVDDVTSNGPLSTHAEHRSTFAGAGRHVVSLSLMLAGMSSPIGCQYQGGRSDPQTQAEITVWPIISGTVRDAFAQPMAGVDVLGDAGATSFRTGPDGRYEISVPYNWTGGIYAESGNVSFQPSLRTFGNVVSDIVDQDFAARPGDDNSVILSGLISEASGAPVSGVAVSVTGVSPNPTTGANGRFLAVVQKGWSGSITPSDTRFSFAPPSATLQNVQTDQQLVFLASGATSGNTPPSVPDQSVNTSEDSPVTIVLNAIDADGDPLTFKILTLPQHGRLNDNSNGLPINTVPYSMSDGNIVVYTPDSNFSGDDSFNVGANDGQDDSAAGEVTVGVGAANDAPEAFPQSVTTNEDTSKLISLAGNDVEGDPLSYVVVSLPTKGRLRDNGTSQFITSNLLPYTLAGGGDNVTLVPDANKNGADSFLFRVYDGQASSASATVTITITPVNDAPSANNQAVSATTGMGKTITLTGSDIEGSPLTFSIVAQPAHGTLSGSSPTFTYTATSGYTGSDSFTFRAYDGAAFSTNGTVSITVSDVVFNPPIGIPAPAFGITQRHTMYASSQWNYGSGPETYRNAGDGPYTHYVDNTHGASTDTNNTFGSPSKPRKTIPSTLPAGSVVELHGGPYTYNTGGVIRFTSQGTASQPVFVRGVSTSAYVTFSKPMEFLGQYMILENIDLNAWATSGWTGFSFDGTNNIAVRHCEVRNGPEATTSAVAIGGGATQIVIYDVKIHDNGDWQATYDQDHHGVGVGDATNVWVLDCEMYHNSGDGIQINGSLATQFIYVGRCVSWQNKQCGFWTKKASDVIFSQNTAYNHVPSDSSPGAGMGFQYGPERVWFLYNHIHDNVFGIMGASDSGANDGLYIYAVGNVIHDIHALGGFDGNTAWTDGLAIHMRGGDKRYFVNNTIYDCDAGVAGTYGGEFHIENNLISNLTGANARHIFIEDSFNSTASTVKNNCFGGTVRINWGGSTVYNLSSFQSGTGKGQGCINATPLYVNAATDDFRLQAASPGVNAGIAADVFATFQTRYGLSIAIDPDGVSRPAGAAFDMGSYER